VNVRRGRRRQHLLDNVKEKKRITEIKKEESLDRTRWRNGFGRGYGPAVRQTEV
jgi:hypothetical protein